MDQFLTLQHIYVGRRAHFQGVVFHPVPCVGIISAESLFLDLFWAGAAFCLARRHATAKTTGTAELDGVPLGNSMAKIGTGTAELQGSQKGAQIKGFYFQSLFLD